MGPDTDPRFGKDARQVVLACRLLQEPCQLPTANRMLQFAYCLGFDLSHALTCDLEYSPHFFQGVGVTISQSVTESDDLTLAVGKRFEQVVNFLSKDSIVGYLYRVITGNIFDEFAEAAVLAFTNGSIKTCRMAADVKDPFYFLDTQINPASQLFSCRFSTQFLQELLLRISQF